MTKTMQSRGTRGWQLVVAGLVAIAAAAGCSGGVSAGGRLGEDRSILAGCGKQPVASMVEIDGTGSSGSKAIAEERMTALESIVRRTAVCSGRLRVLLFSGSSASTTVLVDESLRLPGATDNARLRRVPDRVAQVMAGIRQRYGPAVAALPGGGSDITAQYRDASEWITQVGGGARLHLYVFTDGFQNVGRVTLGRPLTQQQAADLAGRTSVPRLTGASVVVAGLGRVAGRPPRSDVVEGMVAYYDALCRRTGATTCLSVTDYAAATR